MKEKSKLKHSQLKLKYLKYIKIIKKNIWCKDIKYVKF